LLTPAAARSRRLAEKLTRYREQDSRSWLNPAYTGVAVACSAGVTNLYHVSLPAAQPPVRAAVSGLAYVCGPAPSGCEAVSTTRVSGRFDVEVLSIG